MDPQRHAGLAKMGPGRCQDVIVITYTEQAALSGARKLSFDIGNYVNVCSCPGSSVSKWISEEIVFDVAIFEINH